MGEKEREREKEKEQLFFGYESAWKKGTKLFDKPEKNQQQNRATL